MMRPATETCQLPRKQGASTARSSYSCPVAARRETERQSGRVGRRRARLRDDVNGPRRKQPWVEPRGGPQGPQGPAGQPNWDGEVPGSRVEGWGVGWLRVRFPWWTAAQRYTLVLRAGTIRGSRCRLSSPDEGGCGFAQGRRGEVGRQRAGAGVCGRGSGCGMAVEWLWVAVGGWVCVGENAGVPGMGVWRKPPAGIIVHPAKKCRNPTRLISFPRSNLQPPLSTSSLALSLQLASPTSTRSARAYTLVRCAHTTDPPSEKGNGHAFCRLRLPVLRGSEGIAIDKSTRVSWPACSTHPRINRGRSIHPVV